MRRGCTVFTPKVQPCSVLLLEVQNEQAASLGKDQIDHATVLNTVHLQPCCVGAQSHIA